MWWCGAVAGGCAALVLLLLLRRRARRTSKGHDPPIQVHIVRAWSPPRVVTVSFESRPADDPLPRSPPAAVPPAPPFPVARPLASLPSTALIPLPQATSRTNKYSLTRSPSLENDRSPAVADEVFSFEVRIDKRGNMSEEKGNMSPGDLKKFRSVTKLNIHVTDGQETRRSELQNSPRLLECSSAKEKSNASKFDFSPKIYADSLCSPRFFTPPETVSPMFFAEPSPKSVYYDTVKSPKFFPETPRDVHDLPQSPRALADHLNRNNGFEKPNSPRILLPNSASKPKSPKVYSCNKENYFTFENVGSEEASSRLSPRPRRYLGRNSIEKERFTPPADKEVKKYRRHNSCDTYKNTDNFAKIDKNEKIEQINDNVLVTEDVLDCAVPIEPVTKEIDLEHTDLLTPAQSNSAQMRRQRLKSISLDSDNAKIIEQNLGLPIAKQMKDQMNEAYKNLDLSTSCESVDRTPTERPLFKFDDVKDKPNEIDSKSPDLKVKKGLRQSSDTQSFIDMPRFSPKEFEITVTSEEGATTTAEINSKRKGNKNLRNLTIDLTKRDSDLEKELLEFEKLYTDAEEKKVKTPTLKVKATSLDSSETVNLSLPQKKTLDVPQNSISVPNTPKRQLRLLGQKVMKHDHQKLGYNFQSSDQRRLYMKGQDSGIFLRENHASLMLYQPGNSRMGSRTMGSFDENMADNPDIEKDRNVSLDNRMGFHTDQSQTLGSNLLNYKQNLSVSSTNLKTLPEGVPSDDFEPSADDEKFIKKLHRRNSNQSLMLGIDKYSTHSLQSSNCSLSSAGASCHNLASVRTSLSNFSLNTDSRSKVLSLERRDSNASMGVSVDHLTPTTRVICSSNTNLTGESTSKNCLLQRRGSNNSLTLNIHSNTLSRHSSNSSLNKDVKTQKKGLLERRSSNTSLTLNINNSNPQLSVNRGLSVSNYNLNGSTCNLSRYNSNQSIDNTAEPRKGILERRSSNTSLTLNISHEPRDLEIDEKIIETNLKELPHKHRKSLSTENLLPKSYKNRMKLCTENKFIGFGSHDNLWSSSFATDQENLTYICGDQENELIYAIGRSDVPNLQNQGFTRNITTKPLSPQTTSEDFRLYLANMQHLQNASSVLTRQQLRDLNEVFQNGYSKVKCHSTSEGKHCCSGRVEETDYKDNPQMVIPDVTSQPCSEYQKMLLRKLHQEFWDMPTNFQEKPIVSGSNQKNRYKPILPNEHSRFILKAQAVATAEGYINANFIKGHEYTKNSYIATQGPLQNTIYDFWLMVHQNQKNFLAQKSNEPGSSSTKENCVQKVVMLTNFIENNRQKCEKYFPLELNEESKFEDPEPIEANFFSEEPKRKSSITIKNMGVINKPGYTIRKLNVKHNVLSDSKPICDVKKVLSDERKVDDKATVNVNEASCKRDEAMVNVNKASVSSDEATVNSDEVTVYHYWFHNWADHKCPKDVDALLNLSLDVLKDTKYDFNEINEGIQDQCSCSEANTDSRFVFPPLEAELMEGSVKCKLTSPLNFSSECMSPPTIVHCSAGIGRTGCLIAILNGIKQLTNEHKVDVLGIVCNMRLNRGGMVQNSEQYELIHKVLCLFEQACLPEL